MSLKLPRRDPAELAPDWQRPLSSLLLSVGVQLHSAIAREGCVHLLLQLWVMDGHSDPADLAFLAR